MIFVSHNGDVSPQRWTVNLSETCRVLYQRKSRNSASRWILL